MLESQRAMMSQLTQLLADKGKGPAINSGVDQEDPVYPPGFAPTSTQAQPDMCQQEAHVHTRPQCQKRQE